MPTRAFYPLLLIFLFVPCAWGGERPPESPFASANKRPPKTYRPTDFLEAFWPNYPESLAMTLEILDRRQAEPGFGWYRKGASQVKFGWDWASDKLDANHDGKISYIEYAGTEADFRRLDRDHNGALNPSDFVFPVNETAICRSKMVLSFADRDNNGKITRDESDQMLYQAIRDPITRTRYFADAVEEVIARRKQLDAEKIDFLSLTDLQETIDRMAVFRALPQPPDPASDNEVASQTTLLKTFFRRELGTMNSGPALNDRAHDFTLGSVNGVEKITLSKLRGSKPLILIFGSVTNVGFRAAAGSLNQLYRRYRHRAEFLMVYVRESNPADGWVLLANEQKEIKIRQPRDMGTRRQVAGRCQSRLQLEIPVVVDTLDDAVGSLYSGIPSRLYLVDRDGRIAYKGGRGPFGFKPAELEQSLLLLLRNSGS